MKACCSPDGPLIHAASIEEIISQATVSKSLKEALEEAIADSESLREWLTEKITALPVVRGDLRLRRFSGSVEKVYDVGIYNVNVFEREGTTFSCELEVEAGLDIRIETEHEDEDAYEPDEYFSTIRRHVFDKTVHRTFSAQVEVTFSLDKPEEMEVHSVYVDSSEIELDYHELLGR